MSTSLFYGQNCPGAAAPAGGGPPLVAGGPPMSKLPIIVSRRNKKTVRCRELIVPFVPRCRRGAVGGGKFAVVWKSSVYCFSGCRWWFFELCAQKNDLYSIRFFASSLITRYMLIYLSFDLNYPFQFFLVLLDLFITCRVQKSAIQLNSHYYHLKSK